MKLQDPRLEALLAAYRDERRPSEAARAQMWERLVEQRRPRRAWVRAAVAAAVAVAALVVLWLAIRGPTGALVRGREPGTGTQAPFGHEAAPTRGAAAAAGGRAAGVDEAVDAATVVEPPASEASARPDADEALGARARASASGSRSAPGTTSVPAAPEPDASQGAPFDDLGLVEAAEAALRAGAPARALELLRRHEERFPSAPTAEERAALRVLALCAAGREVEGRGARWAFLREHPRSAYRERIEKACPGT